MIHTLCIDPSARCTGVALFTESIHGNPRVRAAGVLRPALKGIGPDVCLAQCHMLYRYLKDLIDTGEVISNVVVEVPRVYGASNQKGDQNDLIAVGGVGYGLACFVQPTSIVRYFPSDWKGTIDGDECVRRVKERLAMDEVKSVGSGFEAPPKSLEHNMYDAIGIGLKFFGRFEPRRVYPR